MTEQAIGVVGLGSMGLGMVKSLLRAGFQVIGTDLNQAQCDAAAEAGATIVDDIQSLCQQSSTILLSLPMTKHVQQVILADNGILAHAQPETLIIDTSTSEPDVTRKLASTLQQQGHSLLDAPVSGGPAGATAGTLVMVIGGQAHDLTRARPYLDALTAKIVHLGDSGSGHAAKLINNLLCAAHLLTTAEALALGRNAGLDPAKLLEGINAGSGRSAVSEVNYPRWILDGGFDSGFTMGLMRKDVRLAQQLVEQMDQTMPMSALIGELWAASSNALADNEDFNQITTISDKGAQA